MAVWCVLPRQTSPPFCAVGSEPIPGRGPGSREDSPEEHRPGVGAERRAGSPSCRLHGPTRGCVTSAASHELALTLEGVKAATTEATRVPHRGESRPTLGGGRDALKAELMGWLALGVWEEESH